MRVASMRWPRKKPYDPRKGGSAKQREISALIDRQLEAEKAQARIRARQELGILLVGSSSATARFLADFERHVTVRPERDIDGIIGERAGAIAEPEIPPGPATGHTDELHAPCQETAQQESHIEDVALADLAGELYQMKAFSVYTANTQSSRDVDLLVGS
jgi:hypothetical protein